MANRRNYSVTMNGSGTSRSNGGTVVSSSKPSMHASRTGSDYSRRKPIGQRWVPPTPYSMTETSWKNPSGSHSHVVVPGNSLQESGFLPGATSVTSLVSQLNAAAGIPGTFPSDLANRALINARNNLKDTNLDLGVAFGERRETARFVGDSLELMANFLSALRDARKLKTKKSKKKLKRIVERVTGKDSYDAFKKIPSLRLQWQYAVKPLVSDIYGAVTALDDHANDRWKVTAKGKANYKAKTSKLLAQTDAIDQCEGTADILYGCMVRIDVQPGNNALRKASQFGLTNPASLAWELIPLSFVLDWAYPLGDYFSSLDAMVGWELLGFSTSNFTKKRYEFQGTNKVFSGWQSCSNAWTAKYRTVSVARSVASSVPFPMLPSIKDPFSHSHVADGLAILTQVISKFK